jgi:hypothetical protein
MAQLSRRTLHRLRQKVEEVGDLADTATDSAQPCGADVPKEATPSPDTETAKNGTAERPAALHGGRL